MQAGTPFLLGIILVFFLMLLISLGISPFFLGFCLVLIKFAVIECVHSISSSQGAIPCNFWLNFAVSAYIHNLPIHIIIQTIDTILSFFD